MNTKETIQRLAVALVLLSLCGCASHYVIKLNNGSTVTTASKPKLKGSTYYYKDAKGDMVSLPQSRVREIEPASMAAEENKQFTPPEPYKKPWWHFW